MLNCRFITDSPSMAILTRIEKCAINNRRNENQCHTSRRLSVFSYSDVGCCRSSVADETTEWVLHYYHQQRGTAGAILLKNAAPPFCLCHQPVSHRVNVFPLTVLYFIRSVCLHVYSVCVFGALCPRVRISVDTKFF